MTRGGRTGPGLSDLAFGVALAAIAGYVDAIGFTRLFGVFPANQSGNVVLFGIALGDGSGSGAWRPALAMVAFAAGVVLSYRAGRRLPEVHRRWALLTVEAIALALLALVVGEGLPAHAPMDGGKEVLALALAAAAMGIQTDVLRQVSGVAISTTYQSGALVRLSESAADAGSGAGADAARHALTVVATVMAGYVGGAALGTLVARHWGGALWVPVLVAVAACRVRRGARIPAVAPSPRRRRRGWSGTVEKGPVQRRRTPSRLVTAGPRLDEGVPSAGPQHHDHRVGTFNAVSPGTQRILAVAGRTSVWTSTCTCSASTGPAATTASAPASPTSPGAPRRSE